MLHYSHPCFLLGFQHLLGRKPWKKAKKPWLEVLVMLFSSQNWNQGHHLMVSYPTVLLSWITSWECDTPCAHQSLEVLTTNCSTLSKIQQTKWFFFSFKHYLINFPLWLRDYRGGPLNWAPLGKLILVSKSLPLSVWKIVSTSRDNRQQPGLQAATCWWWS